MAVAGRGRVSELPEGHTLVAFTAATCVCW